MKASKLQEAVAAAGGTDKAGLEPVSNIYLKLHPSARMRQGKMCHNSAHRGCTKAVNAL
jgi:hypothetical protein